jgi:membrane-associated phospholipid phosphatase
MATQATARATLRSRWEMIAQSLRRPYRVTIPLVVLFVLPFFYIFIAALVREQARALHAPAVAWDRLLSLGPVWTLVYAPLYMVLILLPVFVVREPGLLRRTVLAYLTVWTAAFVCFLAYPTFAPRPAKMLGTGFAVWALRFLYDLDPPYNCFPSLHVAHSFVSALACYRVQRRVGYFAIISAALVGVSTLFTKQHYILDVIAGILLAGVAYLVFLRGHSRADVTESDRLVAPVFTLALLAFALLALAGFWVAYQFVGD